MAAVEISFRDRLVDSFSQQLSEYELLKAMYPNNDDIVLTDSQVLEDIMNFVENKYETEYTPSHLDFVLNLIIDGFKLEISINLPSLYPSEEPDLYVRCNQLNRQQETQLNHGLLNFIKDNFVEEVCVYSAVSWLQENILSFTEQTSNKLNISENMAAGKCTNEEKFTRLWIYSHHIYNKRKRDEIESRAKEFKLTGFCLPGKPGIICVEGPESDCKEWWSIIKAMSWKKICVKATETFDITDQDKEQKFSKFEEIHFQNYGAHKQTNKHSDTSALFKFMEERGLGNIFKDLFGLSEF